MNTYPAGPTCDRCQHASCAWIENDYDESVYGNGDYCPRHGWQKVLSSGSNPGRVYWDKMECGCVLMEDYSYLES